MQLDIERVRAINQEIEAIGPFDTNSIGALIEAGVRLAGWLPWTGEQMALAKKQVNDKRAQAYNTHIFNQSARGLQVFPSIARDYVNAKCSEEQFNYDLCERCNRSLVHVLDLLRSVLSTLKEEMKLAQSGTFQQ